MPESIRSKIGFGCVGLSAQPFERTALNLLYSAFNSGITHFDTAPLYGKGYSEKILGKFLKKHRKEVTITTKFGLSGGETKIPSSVALPLNYFRKKIKKQPEIKDTFREPGLLSYRSIDVSSIQKSLETSLRNLRTDHIDYYLLHEAMPQFLTEEAISFVLSLKQKGIIKKIGIASSYPNFTVDQLQSTKEWDILQYENSLLHPSDYLINTFPQKEHFYHSILKPLKYKNVKLSIQKEIAGILLAKALKNNCRRLLFSSSKPENIKQNIFNVENYSNYPVSQLDSILADAFY